MLIKKFMSDYYFRSEQLLACRLAEEDLVCPEHPLPAEGAAEGRGVQRVLHLLLPGGVVPQQGVVAGQAGTGVAAGQEHRGHPRGETHLALQLFRRFLHITSTSLHPRLPHLLHSWWNLQSLATENWREVGGRRRGGLVRGGEGEVVVEYSHESVGIASQGQFQNT